MPELPDIQVYLDGLQSRIVGQRINRIRVLKPFLVRTFDPPVKSAEGSVVVGLSRLGKRIVWEMEGDLFLVFHLMVAGRYRWYDRSKRTKPKLGKIALAAFEFATGTLVLTEAGTTRRASLHLLQGKSALSDHDPGGLEVLDSDESTFAKILRSENHTLKRALTDPKLFSGIGNAYSDEILFAARISPVKLTRKLSDAEISLVHRATVDILSIWTDCLCRQFHDEFPGPGDITAFRPEFNVHGKYLKPCRVCGTSVQRIRYASNETNYCPRCQTGGKILRDRSLSLLLKKDWPSSIEELEG